MGVTVSRTSKTAHSSSRDTSRDPVNGDDQSKQSKYALPAGTNYEHTVSRPKYIIRHDNILINVNVNVNVNVIVVLNANVLRLDEDRRQRRSGISFWT